MVTLGMQMRSGTTRSNGGLRRDLLSNFGLGRTRSDGVRRTPSKGRIHEREPSTAVVRPGGRGLGDIAWVAERLGVTPRFVRRLVAERRIDYIKVGGRVRFDSADVERFIDNGRHRASVSAGKTTQA